MNRRFLTVVGAMAVLHACALSSPPSDALDELDALPRAGDTTPTTDAATPATTAPPAIDVDACERLHAESFSLAPTDTVEPGSFVAELRADPDRRLRVGVDETTLGLSFRGRSGEIEGFEVELAHEIAKRVLGDAYRPERVQLVPVVTDTKTAWVRDGHLDLSISANSMTCSRWEEVAFSAEYFTAHQQFLVRPGVTLEDADDLADLTVCVTAGSSSKRILEKYETDPYEVETRTDCLVALEQGDADVYFGHDSFLYGMVEQDPTMQIVEGILPPDTTVSHYGVAISHDRPDLVRAVNGALEQIDADGTWERLYGDLQAELGLPDASPPVRHYRDGG